MTFGEKLKKLRCDNGLTQEQLAEKIFVTRTAISKWETDKGYPSIDSLKQLSNLFQVSIDDLISDDDIENKKLLDEKMAKTLYFIAIAFFGVTLLFAMLAYFLELPYLNIFTACGAILYVVFAFLSKSKYLGMQTRNITVRYIIARIIVFIIVLVAITFMFVTL